jgi:hypothetical protein
MWQDILDILCGVLGVIAQSLILLRGLLRDAQIANIDFNWKKDYVRKDSPSILLAFVSVLIWFLIFGEVAHKYPNLEGFRRVSFVLMGGVGSWLVQAVFGTAKDRIRKIMDRKTDIADGKVPKP